MGSLFDLNADVDELSLLSSFHLHLPAGENHNVGNHITVCLNSVSIQ